MKLNDPGNVALALFIATTTANAMANMRSRVEKHGPAPRAILAVPSVGAFFIHFTHAVVVTGFGNALS